ncbi:MAG TPA: S9 family peptidase [Longimicrobium sp.]|nr:S9 family peptidase [Longimicrobium sp.]
MGIRRPALDRLLPRATLRRVLLISACAAAALAATRAPAQDSTVARSLRRIFASRDFATEPFGPARWLADGNAYTTLEPSGEVQGAMDIVRYDAASGSRQVLVSARRLVPPGASAALTVADYAWSADGSRLLVFTNTRKVWRDNTRGDYWVLDLGTGALRKLGGADAPEASLMFAKFSPLGDRVAYVRQGDLYVERLSDGQLTRLTSNGSRTLVNGTTDWVYEEEFGLRDAFRWSPDGRQIAYWQFDMTGVRDFLLINDTDSLYSFVVPVQYPKAGGTNSAVRAGVVSAEGGPTRWLELPGDPRDDYLPRMEWTPDSRALALQRMNRLQNTDRLMLADASTGAVRTVLTERDSAWVDVVEDFRWLGGGAEFLWVSERDGWRHLYAGKRDGSLRLITPGAYDVISVQAVDEPGGWVYFAASPSNATQSYLYRARLSGGPAERLSPARAAGTHRYQISPNARWAIHSFSSFDLPRELDLVRLPTHAAVRTLSENRAARAAVAPLVHRPTEFFKVDIGDGVQLDGWMIVPRDFDPSRKYPVLVYVYSEPAAQTVLDSWGGGNALWHRMVADLGYVVVSVDNRGTPAPRGRAWRKVVYGAVSDLASRDQAQAMRALLRSRPYLDPSRVAIWGWSGGGGATLNALFRYPDLYGVGMSVAPVPDSHFYDTIYTERYMGLPQQNEEGYRRSASYTYAEGLRGKLLIVHGSGDDNVHYQGTERLVNRLVELGKPFDLMVYPNRSHCICEGDGTTLHLFSLLTRYLTENLPAGGR